jgi:hypothetical protein
LGSFLGIENSSSRLEFGTNDEGDDEVVEGEGISVGEVEFPVIRIQKSKRINEQIVSIQKRTINQNTFEP